MKVLYSNQDPLREPEPNSIFLVGPTPRSKDVPSWRPTALRILEGLQFDGTVCVPEWDSYTAKMDYMPQVEWEYFCLWNCGVIAVWLPRNMETMPALTTNTEIGFWLAKDPMKVWYGRPEGAPSTRYQDWLYTKMTNGIPMSTLQSLMSMCISAIAFNRFYAIKALESHWRMNGPA